MQHNHNIIPYDKNDSSAGFPKPCECGESFWMQYYCPKSTDNLCHYIQRDEFDKLADKESKINDPVLNEDERLQRIEHRKKYVKNNSHLMDKCLHCEQYDYGFGWWRKKKHE